MVDDTLTPLPGSETKVYGRRWLMLAMFVTLSMTSAFQWIMYSIISDAIMGYYNVEAFAVDWTSMIYMVTYIPLILPGSWLLDKKGLRWALVLAALGTCAGSWIKVFSVARDRYWVTFLGQTVVAVSQVFILNVPARLAAVWFGPGQVSSACSIGVFGNQLGVALGFVVPPMLVQNNTTNPELIGDQLRVLFYIVAITTSVLLVLILVTFQAGPPLPPSPAQATIKATENEGFFISVKRLSTNPAYILLLVSYGVNIAVFYAISTLLNQVVLKVFPSSHDAGNIGLVIVLAGMMGSVVCGVVLDSTGKFKETTLAVYALSLIGMVVYTYSFFTGLIWVVYLASAVLGFFMTGYLPVGFEFAAELTYPEPEGTSAGLLNAAVQLFGILFTMFYGWVFERSGHLYANVAMCLALLVGTIMTALIKNDLRRQAAQKCPMERAITVSTIGGAEQCAASLLEELNAAFEYY
ncbi:feline leukemia virus subgroup C receptor-related protein 2 isoform X2 [Thrips palmi]|uniref:Choline/ethanolamine transporter FLVCR1 n=1 Tax=Thrips palmi TaxID=161013 RepID=A0A6P8Z7B0_THRPL|nr:feline leukemia virus subgroup C receptor-related protein 2 isoform X2 [Thrips palmi]